MLDYFDFVAAPFHRFNVPEREKIQFIAFVYIFFGSFSQSGR